MARCPNLVFVAIILLTVPAVRSRGYQCGTNDDCSHGVCVSDRCFCEESWGGESCSQPILPTTAAAATMPREAYSDVVGSADLHRSQVSQALTHDQVEEPAEWPHLVEEPAELPHNENVGPCVTDTDCSGHGLCRVGTCYCVDPFVGERCAFQHPGTPTATVAKQSSNLEAAAMSISAQVRKRLTVVKTMSSDPSQDLQAHSKPSAAGLLAAVKKSSQTLAKTPADIHDPNVAQIRAVNVYLQFVVYAAGMLAAIIIISIVCYLVCCVEPVRQRLLYLTTGDKEVRWTFASAVGFAQVVEITDIDVIDFQMSSWFGVSEVFLRVENNPNMPIKTNMKRPVKYAKNAYRVFFDRVELNVWPHGDEISIDIMEQDFIGNDVVGGCKMKSDAVLDWARGGAPATVDTTATRSAGGTNIKGKHKFKLKNPDDDIIGTLSCNFTLLDEP